MAKKEHKRPIQVTLQRLTHKSSKEIWVRYYSSVTNAIRRGVELAILTGHPGDVLEITSSNFGYLIATVKLSVNAKSLANLKIDFHIEGTLESERALHNPISKENQSVKQK